MEHRIVSRDQWLLERTALLAREKEMTRLRDEMSEARRALPWVKVDKSYVFDTPAGKKTLSDLFEGRSQLIVKFFMLAPSQKEGCVGCSFEADHVDGTLVHLRNHDVSYVAVARAPLDEIEAFKTRMGWSFNWVSSFGSEFSYDFHASFKPAQLVDGSAFYNFRTGPVPLEDLSGFAVFYKDEQGRIFHTYSTFGRGLEEVLGTYMFLDITPNGRNENGPNHSLTDWVRHHDRYGADGHVSAVGRWVPAEQKAGCCHGAAAEQAMLCCAVGVAAVATGAIGWRRFRRFLHAPLKAQSLLAAGAAAAVVITVTALSVEHFWHHAAHASGPDMAFGDPLPLCSGGDRTTNLASNED